MKTVTERILIIIGSIFLIISVYFYPIFIGKFIPTESSLVVDNFMIQWLIGIVLLLVTWVIVEVVFGTITYILLPLGFFIRYGAWVRWDRFQVYKVEIKNGTYETCKY